MLEKNLKPPTLEELESLPVAALWLEVGELAVHGVPLVAQEANDLINNDYATITPLQVFALWQRHEELTNNHQSW
ncbi:MAG: hypothetical protein EB117_12425 [Betaproteobacteria bacterium]|nr:hypothetical protein [Betaproteobacteria bacterium]